VCIAGSLYTNLLVIPVLILAQINTYDNRFKFTRSTSSVQSVSHGGMLKRMTPMTIGAQVLCRSRVECAETTAVVGIITPIGTEMRYIEGMKRCVREYFLGNGRRNTEHVPELNRVRETVRQISLRRQGSVCRFDKWKTTGSDL
jgi:hypothetical protein